MVAKILCVAEKPSIAKAVANHLAGSTVPASNVSGIRWLKNYEFDFSFGQPWGHCSVTMTSVAGHLDRLEFDERYRKWNSCDPGSLFDAPVSNIIDKDKQPIARNIKQQARYAKALFIWTDCDREGEHIGSEIRKLAQEANPRIEVKRARFSNIEKAHVLNAARQPIDLDELQANAVAARIELDLRIGASFTRLQTLSLQPLGEELQGLTISYGSCQFPTLGFVVDRYFRVKSFKPEKHWRIEMIHQREGKKVNFRWDRVHLFDRMAATILFERCLAARTAKVVKVQTKPTNKWRPLPLTTVELQKMGSRFLGMDSQRVMKIAEDLYTKGFISYPRTETDQFDRAIDLKKLCEKQKNDPSWGQYASGLCEGGFRTPRAGKNNDRAHPPIHPVIHVTRDKLSPEERKVYEFVVRRFLACCSEDAKGNITTVEVEYGSEIFSSSGLVVLERNYLDVYPYDKWESSSQLPQYSAGEKFVPNEANLVQGKTTPPGYLTEPELIALMDANGIGTDATMAEHIAKIKERQYVMVQARSGGPILPDDDAEEDRGATQRRSRGASSRRGRGASQNGGGSSRTQRSGLQEFIPSTLGVALIQGYDDVGFEVSLSKPFLRKEVSWVK
ncbi:prokaryotic type I DNA topoisomerase [Xylona heveae TC161]|uniref:DNA topoisomerase n=1 Tax=Xylona heveae (strain CBS 132557 / TC161) TaxID=1328760 RepID=A0A165I063_XYLHT|nr:prokaryotic type I DNA topoisomerase [Xylona heveae TC161]KZF24170.1 prokaryotic type I DNA topoisomerase [Xylona heveae TC161]